MPTMPGTPQGATAGSSSDEEVPREHSEVEADSMVPSSVRQRAFRSSAQELDTPTLEAILAQKKYYESRENLRKHQEAEILLATVSKRKVLASVYLTNLSPGATAM